jgi:hypothetical protein
MVAVGSTTSCPKIKDESSTDLGVHDGHIMQGFADGNISVTGHGGKEKKILL